MALLRSRRAALWLGIATTACSLLAASGSVTAATASSTTAATASVTPAPPLRFGVAYGNALLTGTDAALNAALDDVNAVGATYVRAQLSWNAIEPQPGTFNWAPYDRLVQALGAHHLSLLGLVDFTPPWARPAGCSSWACAPADPNAFAAFARTLAARYAGQGVHSWEIWNEPNSTAFWQPTPSPAAFARLVSATAAAIRSADPSAFVVSGGLAPMPDANGNIDQLTFLKGMCAGGAVGAVDAVGVHPYSYPVPPGYAASWNAWYQMASTPTSDRSILAACGQGSKPLWATEYGAPTNGPGAVATSTNLNLVAHPDHVDEALQATMATQSASLAASSTWLGGLFWYSGQDLGTSTTTVQNFFGLRRYDGSAKPAWGALRTAIAAAATVR